MFIKKILYQNKLNLVLFFIIIVNIIYNLLMLNYSPLPWFDEVYFTSITMSYTETGLFKFSISPLYDSGEVLRYGPLYFILTSWIIKIFGFGLLQFRVLNFIASVSSIYIASLILKKYNISLKEQLIFIVIYIFDAMLVMNSHSGRMDGVAVFFILIFIYLVLNYEKNIWNLPVSGVSFAVAILITPRAIFFMLPIIFYYGFLLITKWKHNRNYLRLLSWAFPPLFLYFSWIFIKFGSIEYFFDYYLQKRNTEMGSDSYLETFIQFSPYILKYQIPLFIIAGLLSIHLFFNYKKIPLIIYFSLANILIFYGFILDTGMYSIFIIPFYYIIIFITLNILKISKKLKYSIYFFFLFFNISLFAIKNIGIIMDINHRDYKVLNTIIDETIPEKSKVVGSEVYYYSIIQNQCNFQTIERGSNWWDRYKYHAEVFDFDYLIVNEQFYINHKGIFEIYHTQEMELVKEIKLSEINNSITVKISEFLDIPSPMYSYNGLIFKRKKNTK